MLGFRYDCEQTPQVWTSCADVRVVPASAPPPPPPAPPAGNSSTFSQCVRPRAPACAATCCNATHPCAQLHCGRCASEPGAAGCDPCFQPLGPKMPSNESMTCLPACLECYTAGALTPGAGIPPT